jgi:hypothetical protein
VSSTPRCTASVAAASGTELARSLAQSLAVGGVQARCITRQLARLSGCQRMVLSPRVDP